MANMASVAYAIEGPQKDLEDILGAICLAVAAKNDKWEEWQACINLGFEESELEGYRLGGEISEDPEIKNGVLRFWAEERWGLQDFHEVLQKRFHDRLTIYYVVEECGCEVFCTNDREGKYFPERYWVDTAQDDIYQSEYFQTEEAMYEWLNEKYGVKNKDEVDAWNQDYEATGDDCENFIYIHEFEILDD